MHRYTKADVRSAFENYQEVTGDTRARLQIWSPGDKHGTRFEVNNSQDGASGIAGRTYCGAEEATNAIKRYVCGFLDGRRSAKCPICAGPMEYTEDGCAYCRRGTIISCHTKERRGIA